MNNTANTPHTDPQQTGHTLCPAVQHYLHGLLLNSYPDSDLLGIDFAEQAGHILNGKGLGVPLFVHLWDLLIQAPERLLPTLNSWKTLCNTVSRTMLKRRVYGDSEDVKKALSDIAGEHNPIDAAPMIRMIHAEIKEGGQPGAAFEQASSDADPILSHQVRLITRLSQSVRAVICAIRNDPLAKQYLNVE